MSVGWEHHANELSAFLAGRSRLWLVSHKNPDGDGIGSAAALGLALRQRGFEVAISHPDPIPLRFRMIDALCPARPVAGEAPACDGVIVLDCNETARLGNLEAQVVASGAARFVIDHHPLPIVPSLEGVVRPECSSTGQVLFELFSALHWTVDSAIATALAMAILYDTGSLRLLRGDSAPLRIAAELVEAGADWAAVHRQLNASRTPGQLELMRRGLERIRFSREGRIAYSWVERQDLDECRCEADQARELVNWTSEIESVRFGFVLIEEATERYKVSMRSNRDFPVDRIAAAFGGGGHPSAASARMTGARETLVAELVARFDAVFEGMTG